MGALLTRLVVTVTLTACTERNKEGRSPLWMTPSTLRVRLVSLRTNTGSPELLAWGDMASCKQSDHTILYWPLWPGWHSSMSGWYGMVPEKRKVFPRWPPEDLLDSNKKGCQTYFLVKVMIFNTVPGEPSEGKPSNTSNTSYKWTIFFSQKPHRQFTPCNLQCELEILLCADLEHAIFHFVL